MELIEYFTADSKFIILLGSLILIVVGGFYAYKITRGDVHHSVPWVPWLVPTTAFIVALMGPLIVLIT